MTTTKPNPIKLTCDVRGNRQHGGGEWLLCACDSPPETIELLSSHCTVHMTTWWAFIWAWTDLTTVESGRWNEERFKPGGCILVKNEIYTSQSSLWLFSGQSCEVLSFEWLHDEIKKGISFKIGQIKVINLFWTSFTLSSRVLVDTGFSGQLCQGPSCCWVGPARDTQCSFTGCTVYSFGPDSLTYRLRQASCVSLCPVLMLS